MKLLSKKLLLLVVLIGIDQLLKSYIINNNYNFILNNGVAFGLFNNSNFAGVMLNLLGLVAIILLLKQQFGLGLILILAGGISNMFDRVLYGGVIDFISSFDWWPLFNLADVYVSSGIIVVIYSILRQEKDGIKTQSN